MIAATDIRMGDVVRLRDGRTVEVDSISTSYTDREGTHEGPFVTETKTYHHYPLSDVAEIAERNERLCVFCGDGVTSPNPEVDYCRGCHYSGQAETSRRAEQLAAIATALDGPMVAVEHTGGGCFWVAVRFAGEENYYVLTDGEASLPDQAEGGWRYLGLHSDDEDSPHYNGTVLRYIEERDDSLSDEDAVRDILRHRKGQRPFPRRGESRIIHNARKGSTFEDSTSFKLTVPAELAREIGPDALFRIEVTPEGLLYRWIEGEVVGRPGDATVGDWSR